MPLQLLWLRSDLRSRDNTALHAALAAGPTLALYLITPQQWQAHQDAPCKVDFWRRNLAELSTTLAALNIPLLIRQLDDWQAVPDCLSAVCHSYNIRAVHINEEYGVNETRRDEAVQVALAAQGIPLHRYLDQLFFAPGSLLNKSGGYFQVYSQFRKVCHARLATELPRVLPAPNPQAPLKIASDPLPESISGFAAPDARLQSYWPAGEQAAAQRLEGFVEEHLAFYQTERDFPARRGTSKLSAYLVAGVLSPRQCLQAALRLSEGRFTTDNPGLITWIDELLWREFYRHILHAHPRLSMGRAFKADTEALAWRQAPEELAAWQQGRTGLPIVDAAMRCLLATGWMHNRLRMIVAMFLSKNLLIDWREGERWFMQHLIDGDLAQNNGGWQWSASTGTDAVPYFRLFNPITQSEKFDPEGRFIRQWLPELAGLNNKDIHNPSALGGLFRLADYPRPMVDLAKSRERALKAFQGLSKG